MGRRKARNTDDFFVMNAVGIARESAAIFLQHLSFFVSVAVLVLSPVSVTLLLCRALLFHGHIVNKFTPQIREFANSAGFPNSKYTHLIYNKLSQTIISYMFCFPFVITFSLLARAAVAHTVACIYAGNKPSWHKVIEALSKMWKRLVVTYIWAGMAVVGANAVIVVLVSAVIKAVSALGFSSNWGIGVAVGGGIVYSIVLAQAMIVCNLATVVCILEERNYGMGAVLKALGFIRGRSRIGLVIAIIVNLSWTFVECLFVYRVMRGSSMALEGSLLVFMYSIVSVMNDVMSTVFYYTCKSSRLEEVCLGTCTYCQCKSKYDSRVRVF